MFSQNIVQKIGEGLSYLALRQNPCHIISYEFLENRDEAISLTYLNVILWKLTMAFPGVGSSIRKYILTMTFPGSGSWEVEEIFPERGWQLNYLMEIPCLNLPSSLETNWGLAPDPKSNSWDFPLALAEEGVIPVASGELGDALTHFEEEDWGNAEIKHAALRRFGGGKLVGPEEVLLCTV